MFKMQQRCNHMFTFSLVNTKQASRVKYAAWLSEFILPTVCRREDDSLHFRPHRSDCLHAPAGRQGPRDVPRHSNYRQLCHVHHDPGHLLCHPKCSRAQSAPPNAQHAHHAKLGSQGEARFKHTAKFTGHLSL